MTSKLLVKSNVTEMFSKCVSMLNPLACQLIQAACSIMLTSKTLCLLCAVSYCLHYKIKPASRRLWSGGSAGGTSYIKCLFFCYFPSTHVSVNNGLRPTMADIGTGLSSEPTPLPSLSRICPLTSHCFWTTWTKRPDRGRFPALSKRKTKELDNYGAHRDIFSNVWSLWGGVWWTNPQGQPINENSCVAMTTAWSTCERSSMCNVLMAGR